MRTARRSGFTLIELLTVMSLIAVLGGLGIYFLPSFNDSARAAKGAGQLQNWLQIARTRAMRDGVPTGIRILSADPAKFQYVAQPDDYAVGQATVVANSNAVNFSNPCDLSSNSNVVGDNVAGAGKGDYIEFNGSGLIHRILSVNGNQSLTLVSAMPSAVTPSNQNFASSTIPIPNYRIIRQPRIADDEILELPQNIIVEAGKSVLPPGSEIVFTPNGSVLTAGMPDRAMFWIRDSTKPLPTDGEPTLIVVFARSGLTSAFPVDTGSADPYAFARKY
ncbi:MAG: GspH/FimT family pseudopilin [Gemmataceae bacterium]